MTGPSNCGDSLCLLRDSDGVLAVTAGTEK